MALVSRDQLRGMAEKMIPRIQQKPPTQTEDDKVLEMKLQDAARAALQRLRGLSPMEENALASGVSKFASNPDLSAGERQAELEGLAAFKAGKPVAPEWFDTPLGKLKAGGGG